MMLLKKISLLAAVACCAASASADELRVGIEKSSKTNLPVVQAAYEPFANTIRAAGIIKDLRLSIDAVDGVSAALASQSPALILVHSHASTAAQATGDYTPLASFELTTTERLTLLAGASSGIDTAKELSGKRVIVGKQGGYVSSAAKRLMSSQGVDLSTVQFKYVRYADLKLSMMQGGQADAAFAVDTETIKAWKATGGLVTPIGNFPGKQLLAHSSVNAETKAKLKKLFAADNLSPVTKSALTTAGLRLAAQGN